MIKIIAYFASAKARNDAVKASRIEGVRIRLVGGGIQYKDIFQDRPFILYEVAVGQKEHPEAMHAAIKIQQI